MKKEKMSELEKLKNTKNFLKELKDSMIRNNIKNWGFDIDANEIYNIYSVKMDITFTKWNYSYDFIVDFNIGTYYIDIEDIDNMIKIISLKIKELKGGR